ncbi:MAG TPA: hypothetical protein VK645_20355 [Chitinophagaceae bacterium]|nr:hypothetical protein [Chitinophagaceae bacterium]
MPFNNNSVMLPAKRISLLMVFAVIAFLSFSCKKAIEQKQKNIIIDAMTNGRWYVEQYKENITDVTGDFLGYEFQFYENGNVDGIKNTITKTGTWTTDISNYTISAVFPADASDTLKRLNYTWKITDSYLDYVEAKTTTSGGDNILHLRKK